MITRESIAASLSGGPGFVLVEAPSLRALSGEDSFPDWETWTESWNHLEMDGYMADGGRFRRRRFARFTASNGALTREPHGPHFQGLEYNRLNGGIDRWFEPVTEAIASHPITADLMRLCVDVFTAAEAVSPSSAGFRIEMHQFRIEPTGAEVGRPTPEGMHRDGVDWVFVSLIARTGVAGGKTGIGDADGRALGAFTLTQPMDTVFLDDRRVRHGVTPIEILGPGQPAYRDVLVLTFRTGA
ncbi:MAG: 2OG-Fe dioxygenase family protein [Vicinamibacteria bacterium]